MSSHFAGIERNDLYDFCDRIPSPDIARPIVTAMRGRGLLLSLELQGSRVMLLDKGKPCRFNSVDAILFELDGTPHIDTSLLLVETDKYW